MCRGAPDTSLHPFGGVHKRAVVRRVFRCIRLGGQVGLCCVDDASYWSVASSTTTGAQEVDVAYDVDKFAEMVVHVAGRLADDRAGGATKLNKLVFFAE